MKNLLELRTTPRLLVTDSAADGGICLAYLASSKKPQPATVVFSTGGGWDHVSVSFSSRCPTWDEMCEIKRMFFYPDEVCVEYHPSELEYVNNFPYCLHIWRNQTQEFITPPSWMVGLKRGESESEVRRKAEAELKAMEGK